MIHLTCFYGRAPEQQVVEEERSFGTAHVQFVPSRVRVYVLYVYLIFFFIQSTSIYDIMLVYEMQ